MRLLILTEVFKQFLKLLTVNQLHLLDSQVVDQTSLCYKLPILSSLKSYTIIRGTGPHWWRCLFKFLTCSRLQSEYQLKITSNFLHYRFTLIKSFLFIEVLVLTNKVFWRSALHSKKIQKTAVVLVASKFRAV